MAPADTPAAVAPPPADSEQELPHNIEAEQQLLGAILSANDVLDRIEDLIKPDHFHDPVHAALFTMIQSRITKGLHTDATTLRSFAKDIEKPLELTVVEEFNDEQEAIRIARKEAKGILLACRKV